MYHSLIDCGWPAFPFLSQWVGEHGNEAVTAPSGEVDRPVGPHWPTMYQRGIMGGCQTPFPSEKTAKVPLK